MAPPIIAAPAAFRWTRRSERPLLTSLEHLTQILEGALVTPTRLIGRPTYAVHGRRIVVTAPYFAGADANVPTPQQSVSLQRALQKTVDLAGARGTAVQLRLHRVRQPQLDAKILAELVGRNVANFGPTRTLGEIRKWLPAVRPEAAASTSAVTPSSVTGSLEDAVVKPKHALLPAYITGYSVTVKGIFAGDPKAVKHVAAWGSYAERPGSLRDFALTRFRGPSGVCSVKVVLQIQRTVPSDVPALVPPKSLRRARRRASVTDRAATTRPAIEAAL